MTIVTPEKKPEETTTTTTEPTTQPTPIPTTPTALPQNVVLTTQTEFPSVQAAQSAQQDIIALAHLTAPDMPDVEERKKPLKLSAVIDVSGSMRGEKLRLAKESLTFMVDELTDKDEFGIVAFESSVFVVLPVTKMDSNGKTSAHAAIRRIREMGCTNLSGGLFMGLEQIQGKEHQNPSAIAAPNAFQDPFGGSRQRQPNVVPRRSGGFGNAVQPIPRPVSAPRPKKFRVTVKHQYSQMKRDGKSKHCYWMQIDCDPKQAVEVSVQGNSGAAKTGTDIAFDPQEAPVPAFMISFDKNNSAYPTIIYSLDDPTADESTQTFEVNGAVATKIDPTKPVSPTAAVDTNDNDAPAAEKDPKAETKTPGAAEEEAAVPEFCRAVMIFTDGQANSGITDTDALVAETQKRLSQKDSMDITVYTFGFGESHNSNMLRKISEVTQGSYYFIENTSCMKEAFADCLGGLISVVATDLKLTISVPEESGAKIIRVMTTFPTTGEGNQRVVTLKDLFASEQRDLLVKLQLNSDLSIAPKMELASFKLSYNNCLTDAKDTAEITANIAVETEKFTGTANEQVDEQRNRVEIADAMVAAREAADKNDRVKARTIMTEMKSKTMASATGKSEMMNMMYEQIDDTMDCMESDSRWSREGTKKMSSYATQNQQQRCAFGAPSQPASQPAPSLDAFGAAQPQQQPSAGHTFDALFGNSAKRKMKSKVSQPQPQPQPETKN